MAEDLSQYPDAIDDENRHRPLAVGQPGADDQDLFGASPTPPAPPAFCGHAVWVPNCDTCLAGRGAPPSPTKCAKCGEVIIVPTDTFVTGALGTFHSRCVDGPPSPTTTPSCEHGNRMDEFCGKCPQIGDDEPLQASSSSAPTTTCEHCKQAANLLGDGVQCFTPGCPNRREEAAPIRTEVEAEAWMQNAPDGLPMREGQAEHWAKATKDIADRFDVRDLRDALAVDFALRTAKALPHLVAALRAASARYVRAEQELDEADAELAEANATIERAIALVDGTRLHRDKLRAERDQANARFASLSSEIEKGLPFGADGTDPEDQTPWRRMDGEQQADVFLRAIGWDDTLMEDAEHGFSVTITPEQWDAAVEWFFTRAHIPTALLSRHTPSVSPAIPADE